MRTNLSSILNNSLFILFKLLSFKPYKYNTIEFNSVMTPGLTWLDQ